MLRLFFRRDAFPLQRRIIMHELRDMIALHPQVQGSTNDTLIECVEQCFACAQTCIACADACLAEPMVMQLQQCIRFNLDCADVCLAAGTLGIRRTASNESMIIMLMEACAAACGDCAEECEKHADEHEHCRLCAEMCRECEQSCTEAARSIREAEIA